MRGCCESPQVHGVANMPYVQTYPFAAKMSLERGQAAVKFHIMWGPMRHTASLCAASLVLLLKQILLGNMAVLIVILCDPPQMVRMLSGPYHVRKPAALPNHLLKWREQCHWLYSLTQSRSYRFTCKPSVWDACQESVSHTMTALTCSGF